jgi:hypothetical protein
MVCRKSHVNPWSIITRCLGLCGGPGSIVSIATGYELDGPGIQSWWGRDFPHLSRLANDRLKPTLGLCVVMLKEKLGLWSPSFTETINSHTDM